MPSSKAGSGNCNRFLVGQLLLPVLQHHAANAGQAANRGTKAMDGVTWVYDSCYIASTALNLCAVRPCTFCSAAVDGCSNPPVLCCCWL